VGTPKGRNLLAIPDADCEPARYTPTGVREQDKINEAAFFLREMETRGEDPVAYRYLTSAFLSAARSVLQYAREEAAALL
jgi:hypothetical protein